MLSYDVNTLIYQAETREKASDRKAKGDRKARQIVKAFLQIKMGFGTKATFRCLWRGGKRRAFFLSKKREGMEAKTDQAQRERRHQWNDVFT